MRAASAPAWDHADLVVPKKKRKTKLGTVLGATLLAFAVGAAGITVYYFHRRADVAETKLAALQTDLETARGDLAAAQTQTRRVREDLETSQAGLVAEIEKLKAERDTASQKATEASALAEKLSKVVEASEGGVEVDKDKLTLSLVEKVLFRSGEADLTPKGRKVLEKVAALLKDLQNNQIWVHGHTDDVPIQTEEFASNWELSTARALMVVHFLEGEMKIDGRRLAAVGMGPYRPVSRRNKARNRRIEIVLFPQQVKLLKE